MIGRVALKRHVSTVFLGMYRGAQDVRSKTFSLAAGGAFAAFGRKSVIAPPVRLSGERRIAIGSRVYVGAGSWLQALGEGAAPAIEIGDGTSIAGHCVISATQSVRLGERVLLARGIYISDHIHAYEDTTRAVIDQGIAKVAPVEIGDGAWLGENVVVAPGVTIGTGAVIGGNAVVVEDVPAHSLAVGVPARVVRSFAESPSDVVSLATVTRP
jgi:acetyltransferase-like isoleucine patch superfamily enzyme